MDYMNENQQTQENAPQEMKEEKSTASRETAKDVIEKKEVLHECFAQLLADSSHLRQRLAIDRDDATHPLNIFRERILRIFHDIFTVQYQTEADMQKLLEQLQCARSSLQQLKEKSVKKDIHS